MFVLRGFFLIFSELGIISGRILCFFSWIAFFTHYTNFKSSLPTAEYKTI